MSTTSELLIKIKIAEAAENLQQTTNFLNLMQAIKLGKVIYLSKVKYKLETQLLEHLLSEAKSNRGRAINEHCWITKDRPIVEEDAEHAVYPYPKITHFIIEDLTKLVKKQPTANIEKPFDKLRSITWDEMKTYDEAKLDSTEKILLLKAIIKSLKSKQFADNKAASKILKDINYWARDWKTVNRLGFTDLTSLIIALKEFTKYLNLSSNQTSH